jgi:microcystin-dependent protein
MSNARNLSKVFTLAPLVTLVSQLVSVAGLAPNVATLNNIAAKGGEEPGVLKDFAGPEANIPEGYLACYGQELSRTTYADLFAAIGTTWGVGDGSTTFNLPDFRGRASAGADDMGGSAANRLSLGGVGSAGGVQEVTLTAAQSGMPAHAHTASSTFSDGAADSAGAHSHTSDFGTPADPAGSEQSIQMDAQTASGVSVPTSSDGAHTHTVTGSVSTTVNSASAVDASQAHTNVQPTAVVIKIIKT